MYLRCSLEGDAWVLLVYMEGGKGMPWFLALTPWAGVFHDSGESGMRGGDRKQETGFGWVFQVLLVIRYDR